MFLRYLQSFVTFKNVFKEVGLIERTFKLWERLNLAVLFVNVEARTNLTTILFDKRPSKIFTDSRWRRC